MVSPKFADCKAKCTSYNIVQILFLIFMCFEILSNQHNFYVSGKDKSFEMKTRRIEADLQILKLQVIFIFFFFFLT